MGNRSHGNLSMWLAVVACFVLVLGQGALGAYAQDVTPTNDPAQLNDPTAPQSTPNATETPSSQTIPLSTPEATREAASTPTASRSAQRTEDAIGPGFPSTLATGLAYHTGDDLVWVVEEVRVPLVSDAQSVTSEESFVVQREGESIVRNNATGKRALLSPGDAFFITSDDSYTFMAEDEGAVMWKFSLVDPDQVPSGAFYESPTLTGVNEGVYDMRLVRYVLQPGTTAELPRNSNAGMIMPTTGEVQVDQDGQLGLLGVGDGQAVTGTVSVTNTGSSPAVLLYGYLGVTVNDASAGAAEGSAGAVDTSDDTSSTQNTSSTTSSANETPAAESTTTTTTTTSSGERQPEGGPYVTQINIYAESDIYLTVTVDGVVWFDGTLPAGNWTGAMNGTTFDVTTSNGAATVFQNACGDQFYMGYGENETYSLSADANSCVPPQ